MFRDDIQRSEACSLLLRSLHLDHLWSVHGPTEVACKLLEQRGGPLSSGEATLLLVAFDFWNGEARTSFSDIAYRLDPERQRAVATLLLALAEGSGAIDRWIMERSS